MEKFVSTDFSEMQKDNLNFNFSNKDFNLNLINSKVLLSIAYLAPVEYFIAIANAKEVLLEQYENYQKQTYRNRCKIATSNGIMELNIPVEKSAGSSIRDIKISEHSDWQKQHWRSIETAYNSSAFFEFYSDDLKPFFEKKWVFLWDFNFELQHKIFELLELEPEIAFTTHYETVALDSTLDFRNNIHPKKQAVFEFKPYYQIFEQKYGFIPHLSIIDLLFNMGNEAQLFLNNFTENQSVF